MKPDIHIPVTLRPSRIQVLLLLLVSLLFVLTGIWMIHTGKSGGYPTVAVFGIGLLISGTQLHPRAAFLRLEEEGFTFCALFRSHTVPWAAVEEFGMPHVGLNRMVAWNYTSHYRPAGKARGLSKSISGFEAALPDTYGLKAKELAVLMESWRQKSVASARKRQPSV